MGPGAWGSAFAAWQFHSPAPQTEHSVSLTSPTSSDSTIKSRANPSLFSSSLSSHHRHLASQLRAPSVFPRSCKGSGRTGVAPANTKHSLEFFSGCRHPPTATAPSATRLQRTRHHVSQRDDPLRDRLQPRNSRARPRVRIRAVRLAPRRWLDLQLRARSSITYLLPSSPSSVCPPSSSSRPPRPPHLHVSSSSPSLSLSRVLDSLVAPLVPAPSSPPPIDRAVGEDVEPPLARIGRAASC